MDNSKISAFVKDNKIAHIIWDINENVSNDWEVFWEYAYVRVSKPLYLKYFTKFDNFAFVIGEEIHSEFKKDWSLNKRFQATLVKLQNAKAVKQDLAMF